MGVFFIYNILSPVTLLFDSTFRHTFKSPFIHHPSHFQHAVSFRIPLVLLPYMLCISFFVSPLVSFPGPSPSPGDLSSVWTGGNSQSHVKGGSSSPRLEIIQSVVRRRVSRFVYPSSPSGAFFMSYLYDSLRSPSGVSAKPQGLFSLSVSSLFRGKLYVVYIST
jgi:hypothetical protein